MNRQLSFVRSISYITPWIAPIPNAYFVARSVLVHLEVPIIIAITVGFIIEIIGITSVHTYLWMVDWNTRKRRSDPAAPANIALAFCFLYLLTTLLLSVLLDIYPAFAHYSIGIFPFLGLTGAFNLSLISLQIEREKSTMVGKENLKIERQKLHGISGIPEQDFPKFDTTSYQPLLEIANASRHEKRTMNKQKVIEILRRKPTAGVTEVSKIVGHSRTSIYTYLDELIKEGLVQKTDNGFTVLN
jgi:hypothetical protein